MIGHIRKCLLHESGTYMRLHFTFLNGNQAFNMPKNLCTQNLESKYHIALALFRTFILYRTLYGHNNIISQETNIILNPDLT